MAASVVPNSGVRIGDLLLREGLVTKEQLARAIQEQNQNGTRIGYNLVKLGYVQEAELTRVLARQFRMPAVDLTRFEVDARIAKLITTAPTSAPASPSHVFFGLSRGASGCLPKSDPAT